MNTKTKITFIAVFAVVSMALAGCAPMGADTEDPAAAADSVSISDAWVKAADSGMSAAFGELANDSSTDVTVVSASTEASGMVELHETTENDSGEMMMREIDGGFVIPAGGTLSLAPGANHIMLMDLTAPLVAGEEVTFILTFSDNSQLEFTAPAKDYSGANENYDDGDSGMDMDSDE